MKTKYFSFIIVLISILLFSSKSYAADIPFWGTAYGEQIGLLHMDYITAERPTTDPQFDDAAYYFGPTKQFYISPADGYYVNDATFIPGSSATVAGISAGFGECSVIEGCPLEGYIWSDAIGWIVLDGGKINSAINDPDDGLVDDLYPESRYPRIRTSGNLTGLAWNERTGWIMLSSDSDLATPAGSNRDPATQGETTEWGVFMNSASETITVQGDTTANYNKLRGFAWSEKLGWIKFGAEDVNDLSLFVGAFTNWAPDTTPPVVNSPAVVWFAVGENTGYDLVTYPAMLPTTINWEHFAVDPEGGINESASSLTITLDPIIATDAAWAAQCPDETVVNGAATLVERTDDSNYTDLNMQIIGDLSGLSRGYCKYQLTGFIANGLLNTTAVDVDIYLRAGNYDPSTSKVTLPSGSSPPVSLSAVADGGGNINETGDYVELDVEFNDKAGNPIVDVICDSDTGHADCPERTVSITALINNNLIFDARQSLPPSSDHSTPIRYSDSNIGATGIAMDAITDLANNPEYLGFDAIDEVHQWKIELFQLDTIYPLQIASYAPSSSYSESTGYLTALPNKTFEITQFDYEVDNEELPSTNTDPFYENAIPAETPSGTVQDLSNPADLLSQKAYNLTFSSPLSTLNPTIVDSSGSTITVGVPINFQFDLQNISAVSINATKSELSIDNVFHYLGDSASYMETQEIQDAKISLGQPDSDGIVGWTDPIQGGVARYEMYHGFLPPSATKPATKFYETYPLCLNDLVCSPPSVIDLNTGAYNISGIFGIPQDYSPTPDTDETDPNNYPPGIIDRIDNANFLMAGGSPSDPTTLSPIEIQFTPIDLYSLGIQSTQLRLVQEIAYRLKDQPQATYFAQSPLLPGGMDIKSIGVEAIGTVAGEQIVTGRKFETVGTVSTKKLQEQIRRNVAKLTLDISPCDLSTVADLTSLPTSGPCVFEEATSSKYSPLYAYYHGSSAQSVVLSGDIVAPNRPYTIIITGGANLFFKGNLSYNESLTPNHSSLGFILIADETGNGANAYISHIPTNIVGSLYAEGSLLSKDPVLLSNGLYYGAGTGNVQDLSSQLYWQGTISTRNTIGGAGLKKIPSGVNCFDEDTTLNCAQRYDLDYLRRFTAVTNATTSYIANNGLFSGGGFCDAGSCTLGGILPTIIQLTASNLIDLASETAPFFIEKYQRAINNPPPGFTVTAGVELYQEIR